MMKILDFRTAAAHKHLRGSKLKLEYSDTTIMVLMMKLMMTVAMVVMVWMIMVMVMMIPFLISEQRRHTNIRVARSQKGKTKQWPELGIGKVSN